MRKLMTVLLIMVFLVPVGAMASITIQPISKTAQSASISVGDVISGEEVVWVAPNLNTLGSNGVAYLTAEKTEVNSGSPSPLPVPKDYDRSLKITARTQYGLPLFWTKASGHWHYYYTNKWMCTVTNTGCDYGLGWAGTQVWTKHHLSVSIYDGYHCPSVNFIEADGYFTSDSYYWPPYAAIGVVINVGIYGATTYLWTINWNWD